MKLVASLIVKDEMKRYLKWSIPALTEFCDEVRVLDDNSTDGTYEWLVGQEKVYVLTNYKSSFFGHEGESRNALLDWTLEAEPTHVLAIDADEFISDGHQLRAAVSASLQQPVWTLSMEEVWKVDPNGLSIRVDGGWRPHEVPILWRVPEQMGSEWRIEDKALACGREPVAVRHLFRRAIRTGQSIYHFGWTREAGRAVRYQRYVDHDGGAFHANHHIQSIMWPDKRVRMTYKPWPSSLISLQSELLAMVSS